MVEIVVYPNPHSVGLKFRMYINLNHMYYMDHNQNAFIYIQVICMLNNSFLTW